ncbi:MAG: amidohydrolase family protein [Aliifodinibius sp.]|nr:amidohydrolase family protein [Fodinibius sp.]
MIIDAHYHLEELIEPVEALLEQMQHINVERVSLIPKMQEPVHLSGVVKKASDLLPRLLMSRVRFFGLLLYNSTITSDGRISTLGKKYLLYHKPDNAYIDEVIQSHPNKFYGWIFVNPKTADPLTEVERWYGRQGWIGVKTHPFWHNYPVAMLDEVAGFCAEKSLPLLMHLGSDQESGDYRYLPERHPNLKIIYAHAAVPRYREVWQYAKNKENIFVDLSSSIYMYDKILVGVIRALGAEKCLYGTDGPYGNATQKRMLNRIYRLSLSDHELEKILGRNFLELINE